jgi:hypothetical protein
MFFADFDALREACISYTHSNLTYSQQFSWQPVQPENIGVWMGVCNYICK